MAHVLVTGATGFIGKRLVQVLLEAGHTVFALSNLRGSTAALGQHPKLHLLNGDLRDLSSCQPFPETIAAAYYLVHALGKIRKDLVAEETQVAQNFLSALRPTQCQQVIYLGGIIEDPKALSEHLQSRLAVEAVLKQGPYPATVLRSSIIIGEGSASFEIIRDLVEKLPLMVAPRWVQSRCQPIAVDDVLLYLKASLLQPLCFHKTYDIGGQDVLSFKEVLLRFAQFRKLKRYIFSVPVLSPRLSSYWLVFITSVRYSICSHLVESMKQDTRKLNFLIDQDLPHTCLSYEAALARAFGHIHGKAVASTWIDAWETATPIDLSSFQSVPTRGCFKDIKRVPLQAPAAVVQERIWRLGGEQGWYAMDWAWRLRGFIDKLLGGAGLHLGRRHPTDLAVGDALDFWRVLVADEKKGHLILYAEMKLPGEAWLEFEILAQEKLLRQTATFRPRGFLGRLYWYAMVPFHHIIFRKMAESLAKA